MRRYVILFALCVFFTGIGYYLLTTLNPFDETQIAQLVRSENIKETEEFEEVITELINKGLISEFLNVRNVFLLGSTILLAVLSGFMFVHVAVDKLFFRKFYEDPSLTIALRRGLFACVGLVSIFVYKMYAAEWYLAVLTLGLLLIVELVIGRLVDNQKPPEVIVEPVVELDENGEPMDSLPIPSKVVPLAPKRWQFKMPNIKAWPGQFRDRVMQDIADAQKPETDLLDDETEDEETD